MKRINKIAAALTAVSLAATSAGCTPTIGKGTENALTINGYDVRSGIFVYYTIQAYNEALSNLSSSGTASPTMDDLKKANIEGMDAEDWIQDRATEYCRDFVAVENEFNKLGITLDDADLANFDEIVEYYLNQSSNIDNGIGEESISAILLNSLKLEKVFDYYYGPGGEKGQTDEELRQYYTDNNARVKYIMMSLNDADGNALSDTAKQEVRDLADSYAEQINEVSGTMDKLYKVSELSDEYDEYASTQTTTALDLDLALETTTTTTAAEEEETSTESTTTDPYADEYIMPKYTTTTVNAEEADPTTTTTEPSESEIAYRNFNDFVFNDLALDKAVVYEYDDETIIVIIKEDIAERMNEDDLWSEDSVNSLVESLYYEEYSDWLEDLANGLPLEKNARAYRKYSPFKLTYSS